LSATLVPIPPSKKRADPLYDDRMLQVLQKLDPSGSLDVRDVIYQAESTAAMHLSTSRRHPDEIEENYRLDEKLLVPRPRVVGLFDDVLTTGAHFRAASSLLRRAWPDVAIIGIFIARRVVPDPDESPFDR
jgi:predicted amidophosphoribosyltransferase